MNLVAHVTSFEFPLVTAFLVAGVGIGIAISLTIASYIRRRG